jgi:hypothetical protein
MGTPKLNLCDGMTQGRRGGLETVTEEMKITPATATLSVVPSEDGKAWQAQFTWDDGRVDRVLRFERKQDAEAWTV